MGSVFFAAASECYGRDAALNGHVGIGAAAGQEFVISADRLSGQFGKLNIGPTSVGTQNNRRIIRLSSGRDVQRLFDRKTEFSFAAFFLLFDFNAAADGLIDLFFYFIQCSLRV